VGKKRNVNRTRVEWELKRSMKRFIWGGTLPEATTTLWLNLIGVRINVGGKREESSKGWPTRTWKSHTKVPESGGGCAEC